MGLTENGDKIESTNNERVSRVIENRRNHYKTPNNEKARLKINNYKLKIRMGTNKIQ